MLYKDFDSERFLKQRKRLFKLIDEELEIDSHCKSYEGRMEICFNNRFERDEDEPEITIELACYLAPINGRGVNFQNQEELDALLNQWESNFKESA